MKILRYVGYVLFALVSLVVSLYLTFPWNHAKEFLLSQVNQSTGMKLTVDTLEPAPLTGVRAKGVKLETKPGAEPLALAQLEVKAHVFQLLKGNKGGTVQFPIAQGTVDADVTQTAEGLEIKARIENIELALLPAIADAIGLPLSGVISLEADLFVSSKDPSETRGNLALQGKGLELLAGGKVGGFPVPELAIGDFDWKVPIDKGRAKLDKQTIRGENVEVMVDGEIVVLNPPSRSNLNLNVSFRPTEAFLKKEPLLGALLNNINQAKGADGFYTYAVSGALTQPRLFPRRK